MCGSLGSVDDVAAGSFGLRVRVQAVCPWRTIDERDELFQQSLGMLGECERQCAARWRRK